VNQAYLSLEVLEGDNQYFCSKCVCKRNATRGMRLSALPPVLTVHLMRYVYDANAGQKRKLKDPIKLDETIDFAEVVRDVQVRGRGVCLCVWGGAGAVGGRVKRGDGVAVRSAMRTSGVVYSGTDVVV
jgi:hypothetical protein